MARKSFRDLQQQRSAKADWIYDPTATRAPIPTTRVPVPAPAHTPAPAHIPAPAPAHTPAPAPASIRASAPAQASSDSAHVVSSSRPPHPSRATASAALRKPSCAPATDANLPASPAPAALAASIAPYRLASNPDLEVRATRRKGRGLFWAPRNGRVLQKGEELLRLEPDSVSLLTNMLREVCQGCLTPRPSWLCECGAVVYCSSACRERDTAHQRECVALQVFKARRAEALARAREHSRDVTPEPEGLTEVPKESVRGMARLLFRRAELTSQRRWTRVVHLSNPRDKLPLPEQAELGKTASQLAYYLHCAEPALDPHDVLAGHGLDSAAALLDFAAQYHGNAFALLDRRGNTLGTAVVPDAALMNHTCAPNTAWGYPAGAGVGACFSVVATQPIPPGKEVTTSYLPAATPLHLRSSILRDTYGFDCTCTLCRAGWKTVQATRHALETGTPVPLLGAGPDGAAPLWHDPRDGMLCPQGCGGWLMVPYLGAEELAALQQRGARTGAGKGADAGGGLIQGPCPKCKVRCVWNYAAAQRLRLDGEKTLRQSRIDDVEDAVIIRCIGELRAHLPGVAYPLQELVGLLRA